MSSLIVKQTCVCVFVCADQTPTPTRFLKNCEEVGLFSELAGSFEQDLRKTQEEEERRIKGTVRLQIRKVWNIKRLSIICSVWHSIFNEFDILNLKASSSADTYRG